MISLVSALYDELVHESADKRDELPLGSMGIYRCMRPQQIREIPVHLPMLMLVLSGRKDVSVRNGRQLSVHSGELLILPAETTLHITNYPAVPGKKYVGVAFAFDLEALRQFRKVYGSSLHVWDTTPRWHSKCPMSILVALRQWFQWCRYRDEADRQLVLHRQVELLLLLAQEGLSGNILLSEHPSWKQRVYHLLAMDPAHGWQVQDVCIRLGVSESSLRRRLQEEGVSFREVLEEMRLVSGLALVQETYWTIGKIADAVGYQSQSRFGERFKRRFGMTPSELRRTRVSGQGNNVIKGDGWETGIANDSA